jgi:hypothetical protein
MCLLIVNLGLVNDAAQLNKLSAVQCAVKATVKSEK